MGFDFSDKAKKIFERRREPSHFRGPADSGFLCGGSSVHNGTSFYLMSENHLDFQINSLKEKKSGVGHNYSLKDVVMR